MRRELNRRHVLMAAGLGAAATLAACGKSGDSGADKATKTMPQGEGKTSYPLTLKTTFGSTTVKKRPQRVAVIGGLQDLEALLCLGGKPVFGPTADWPWQKDKLGGYTYPTFDVWGDAGVPFEKVLASKPDLIMAASYGENSKAYKRLAKIAPVLVLPKTTDDDAFELESKDLVTLAGKVLDLQDKAKDAIKKMDQSVADVKKAHPQWQGKTLTFLMNRGEQAGLSITNYSGTTVERICDSFGFAPQPHAKELQGTEGEVSLENMALLDADVMIEVEHGGYGTADQAISWLHGNQLYQNLNVVKNNKVAPYMPDKDGELPMAWAFDYPNPLSTPWMVTEFAKTVDAIIK